MLETLKNKVKQFAMPPRSKLKLVTCFTLRPPCEGTHEDQEECSKIQVIIQGQFYVKHVDADLLEEAAPTADIWAHAGLDKLSSFLRARVRDGSFVPMFPEGHGQKAMLLVIPMGGTARLGSPPHGDEDGSQATPAKAYRRSDTSETELGSDVMEALGRLRTFDRNGDLTEIAQSLEAKFAALATPTKATLPSVSTEEKKEDKKEETKAKPEEEKKDGKKDETEAKPAEEKTADGQDRPDGEALTEKEAKKAEELKKRKLAAHARYMRSYEYSDMKTSQPLVIAKFGETSADAIILRKQGDEKLRVSEIRRHPELPESDDLVQYLILDTSKEVDEEEEIMEQLYSAADESSSSSSSSSSKTSKKKESLTALKEKRQSLQDAVDKKEISQLEQLTSSLQTAIEDFETAAKFAKTTASKAKKK
eukprot:s324_g16.t1